jgi:hypothetical protein
MNRTKIDWKNPKEGWRLDMTWNPIVGCRHGCNYCYARRMNDRFQWIANWNDPIIIPWSIPIVPVYPYTTPVYPYYPWITCETSETKYSNGQISSGISIDYNPGIYNIDIQ